MAAEIVRLHGDENLGGRAIAKRVGIGVSTVFSTLRAAGIGRIGADHVVGVTIEPTMASIVALYEEGLAGSEIAARTAIPRTVVYRKLREGGIDPSANKGRSKAYALTDAQEQEVVRLYGEGTYRNVLALRFGVNPWTIRNILKRRGVDRRYRPIPLTASQREDIGKRYANGATQDSLAKLFGVHQTQISHVISRQGLSRRRFKGGRTKLPGGYVGVLIPHDSPFAPMRLANGYIAEHRYVMAQHLGRTLLENENVHHVFGPKDDNRLENLELWYVSQPAGQRVTDLMKYIATYFPEQMRRLLDNPGSTPVLA